MSTQRILGILLLVVGVGLLLFGLNATESVTETVKEGVTGRYTDKTTWFILSGAAMGLVGILMAFIGGGRTRSA